MKTQLESLTYGCASFAQAPPHDSLCVHGYGRTCRQISGPYDVIDQTYDTPYARISASAHALAMSAYGTVAPEQVLQSFNIE